MLSFFTILKSPYPIGHPAHLEKMILVWGRGCPPQKNRFSEALTDLSFHGSHYKDHKDYKNPLRLNESLNELSVGLSKAFVIDIV